MKKTIAALKKAGRKDLIKRILSYNEVYPDTPAKIADLRQFLQEALARKIVKDPTPFISKIMNDPLYLKDIAGSTRRMKKNLLQPEDYSLEIYWKTKNYLERLITQYDNEPGNFDVNLDIVSLQDLLYEK